eukprot:6380980-Amphidinium_carterae.2
MTWHFTASLGRRCQAVTEIVLSRFKRMSYQFNMGLERKTFICKHFSRVLALHFSVLPRKMVVTTGQMRKPSNRHLPVMCN